MEYILPATFFAIGTIACIVIGGWYILTWMIRGDGFVIALKKILATVFSRKLPSLIKAFFTNSLYFHRLTRYNKVRGLIISAFVIAYVGVILINHTIAEVVPKYGPEDPISVFFYAPFLPYYFNKVIAPNEYTALHAMYAFLDNLFVLVILFGEAYFFYRRYVKKQFPLKPTVEDMASIIITVLWLVFRLVGEGISLIVDNVPDNVGAYWFAAYAISKLIAPLNVDFVIVNEVVWAIAGALLAAFMVAIPTIPKLWHILAGPLTVLANTASAPHPSIVAKAQTFTSKQLVEIDGCLTCAVCAEVCQSYMVTKNVYNTYYGINKELKKIIRKTHGLLATITGKPRLKKDDLKKLSDGAFKCLLCGRCVQFCPEMIDNVTLGISTREYLNAKGLTPENLKLVKDALRETKNVLNMPNEERGMWADYTTTPPPVMKEGAEIAYFVGCMASFSPAVQDIPLAVSEVLTAAGANFTILGGEEWCCGYPLIVGGMKEEATKIIEHNVELIKKLGVKTVVFSCPSCFLTWRTEYPIKDVQLLHHTQFINKLIKEGKLKLKELKMKVTYHDPCDLGRKSHIYNEPREILKSIPGLEFVEMAWNREKSLCCGGGGDVEIVDENLPAEIGKQVIEEAERIGVEVLVTACQQCKRTLLKAAKAAGSNIKVMDIAEIVVRALEES